GADLTAAAVGAVWASAREAQRSAPAEIVQYLPCAVRPDRAEAHRLAKAAIADMLPGFWSLAQRVPSAKAALVRAENLSEADFAAAVPRLRADEQPIDVLDDRFVDAFATAATAPDCPDH